MCISTPTDTAAPGSEVWYTTVLDDLVCWDFN